VLRGNGGVRAEDMTLTQEKKIATIVRRQVTSVLRDILNDPDVGLALQRKAATRLRRSVRSKQEGKLKDLSEVLQRYQH
jgi:hypothetical protein